MLSKNFVRSLAIESLEERRLLAFDPSAVEQELMQLINRFRSDPRNEFDRMIAVAAPIQARDPQVNEQLQIFGVNGNVLRQELQALSPVAPLAWNEVMQNLALEQNAVMIANGVQSHTNYSLAQRLFNLNIGLEPNPGTNTYNSGQNAFDSGKSPGFIHAAYVIDWGGPDSGMQVGRGHRTTIMRDTYTQAASAITSSSASKGPLWNTQFFARIKSADKMAVGAVFEDKNKSGWYDAGEGIGNVQIVFQGAAGTFTTNAMSAGGYQIVLPSGSYTAIASGGSLKQPVALPNVTIGSTHVWANIVYDPSVVAADVLEANNSLSTATLLTGSDQSLSSLSLHAGDVDYFRFISSGTGVANINLNFAHASGNLDLRLLDATGNVIVSSSTSNNTETVAFNLTRGTTYFVEVYSSSNATNPDYLLQLNLPEPARPTAGSDRATWESTAGVLTLSLLTNDTDSDGPASALTPSIQSSGAGTFTINSDKTLSYTPLVGFSGVDRATYVVIDDQGLVSAAARIEIFVLDFTRAHPWRNDRLPIDVNDDGVVSPIDALLIINEFAIHRGWTLPRTLAESLPFFGFLDTSANNSIEPLDALLVVNELNRLRRIGQGEGESLPPSVSIQVLEPQRSPVANVQDSAILQFVLEMDEKKKRHQR